MKKIDVLVWGVKHISANHDTHENTDYQEDGAMCIMDNHVPTVSDLRMLCEDLGIERGPEQSDNIRKLSGASVEQGGIQADSI